MKLKIKHISLIIILTVFFSSCKKDEEEYEINGNVYFSIDNSGVNSGTAYLFGQKVSSGSWNANYSLLGQSAISGGKFNIKIDKESISSFRLDVVVNNCFKIEKYYTSDNFKDNKLSGTYYVDPAADVTIIVKNSNPFDEDDYFEYTITTGYADYPESCEQKKQFYGENINDTIECKVVGNQEVVFDLLWAKNGNTSQAQKIQYCPAGENTEILLLY